MTSNDIDYETARVGSPSRQYGKRQGIFWDEDGRECMPTGSQPHSCVPSALAVLLAARRESWMRFVCSALQQLASKAFLHIAVVPTTPVHVQKAALGAAEDMFCWCNQ